MVMPIYTHSTGGYGPIKDKKFGKITNITIDEVHKWTCGIRIDTDKKESEPIYIRIQNYDEGENEYHSINTFSLCCWSDVLREYPVKKSKHQDSDKCKECQNLLTGQREQLRGVCRCCKAKYNKNTI